MGARCGIARHDRFERIARLFSIRADDLLFGEEERADGEQREDVISPAALVDMLYPNGMIRILQRNPRAAIGDRVVPWFGAGACFDPVGHANAFIYNGGVICVVVAEKYVLGAAKLLHRVEEPGVKRRQAMPSRIAPKPRCSGTSPRPFSSR